MSAPDPKAGAAPYRNPVRAGTLMAEILDVWARASCAANGALTTYDVGCVWPSYTGRPWTKSIGGSVSALRKRGVLVPAIRGSSGLRAWHFQHVDLPAEPAACIDARALTALDALAAAGDTWVSTEALCDRLRAEGATWTSGYVGQSLLRLAKADVARVRHRALAAATGRVRHFWWPVVRELPSEPVVALSYRDAAIRAVEAARAALGVPPSAVEFRAWILAQDAADPLVHVLACRPGTRVTGGADSPGRDARRAAAAHASYALHVGQGHLNRSSARGGAGRRDGGLAVVHAPQACKGGVERRFGLPPFGASETAAAGALEAVYLYRPAEEAARVAHWSGHPAAGRSPLREYLALRLALTRRCLTAILPADRWPEAGAQVERVAQTVAQWLNAAEADGKSFARWRARLVVRRTDHLRAVAGLLAEGRCEDAGLAVGGERVLNTVRTVGEAGLCSAAEANTWRQRAADALGRPQGALQAVVGAARRVPAPGGARAAGRGRGAAPPLDRADVILGLMEHAAGPTAAILLADAAALLGPVLRDAEVLRAFLAALPPAHSDVRRAAVVALGLLGETPPADAELPRDPMDLRALVLGLTLAAAECAYAAVAGLARSATQTSVRALLGDAAARLEFGDVFNVVD